ncbi:DUF108 domain-containing protein [Candidatus Woesearchaeota archaeon]|nr:DUF108 domain-containing protein [Candidatus Woesearchaeota archaeon]
MKVGIVGCGNIGTELALFVDKNKNFKLTAINDVNKGNIEILIKRLKNSKPKISSLDELINHSDLIIESANKDVVEKILTKAHNKKKKIIIMSIGGLLSCLSLLNKTKSEVYFPSGAIAGLDAIKSASMDKIYSVTLTTTKPVKTLKNAPYVIKNKINLDKIKKKKIIFNGKLKDAINGFPKNINVAATLFFASKFKDMRIKIAADPKARKNKHEIEVKGAFGKLNTKVENLPSKNPQTSYLAVLSAKRTLLDITGNIKFGN